jgi:hypothetical protein
MRNPVGATGDEMAVIELTEWQSTPLTARAGEWHSRSQRARLGRKSERSTEAVKRVVCDQSAIVVLGRRG